MVGLGSDFELVLVVLGLDFGGVLALFALILWSLVIWFGISFLWFWG